MTINPAPYQVLRYFDGVEVHWFVVNTLTDELHFDFSHIANAIERSWKVRRDHEIVGGYDDRKDAEHERNRLNSAHLSETYRDCTY